MKDQRLNDNGGTGRTAAVEGRGRGWCGCWCGWVVVACEGLRGFPPTTKVPNLDCSVVNGEVLVGAGVDDIQRNYCTAGLAGH